jgi:hypothetical protein
MTYLKLSPLYPPEKSGQALKGTIVTNEHQTKLVVNAPLRGLGVNRNTTINLSHILKHHAYSGI